MTVGELRAALAGVPDATPVCVRSDSSEYDYEDASIARPFAIDWMDEDDGSVEQRSCFVVE